MDRLLFSTAYLPCFGWVVVANHHLAVVWQSGAKYQFYCAIYYITLNCNCVAQRISKKFDEIVKDMVRGQN